MTTRSPIPLGCIVDPYGNHPAAWLTATAKADAATQLATYKAIARLAEVHGLDFVFVPDSPAMPEGSLAQASRSPRSTNRLEPLTLLAALAAVTERIGLIATVSTSYSEPFTIARQFASLDHISGGRVGWNVVTTENGGAWENYAGQGALAHGDRYLRAQEYVEVVRRLWDSWADDAVVFDQAAGHYFEPSRVKPIDHRGRWFSVKGPLNISRPPQGHPVIVQAGGSPEGRDLAARYADLVFTVQPDIDSARAFYADIKRRASAHGRSPQAIKVLLGTTVVVGMDKADADAQLVALGELIDEEQGRAMVERILEADLSGVSYEAPIPTALIPSSSNRNTTYFNALSDAIRSHGLSLRQVAGRLSATRIGNAFVGDAQQIVDEMETWLEGACDGFMVRPTHFPTSLDVFCDQVVPVLRQRGLIRSAPAAGTLRDALGLPRPSVAGGEVA
ncbi:NtaA/DmoA family FMN-dependent monooxygenase [Pseudomonas sp. B21-036]|jgi:N-acetyl-S-(2-succino)cysteine monooxygenase|uniref:NtaA/DmoA family FMN-dependent monooxygenase n=1 Tax=Pseudomonas sp. B21-036 TaxID=2895485 RepID=UPI00215EAA24|nr:NtaA/DmoA family FMN-dependent monooxygenase [Pseudomonas sp. B21-036]UVL53648.1 NtaA/DmoA family FMN-dependent monooxygenase [Pseudomonas sp. B21-036]